MKKIILFALLIAFSKVSFADQLAYISREQAEETVTYFEDKDIKHVVLWCACCEYDPKVKVTISRIYYKYTGHEKYYEVHIAGKTSGGKSIDEAVDLAYVHIKKNGKWYCLGKELGFECNPCTKPFKL